jgi:hypothetical protein
MIPSAIKVHYESGKKFQTTRECLIMTAVKGYDIETDYCVLSADGWLRIFKGFAWDGASGGIDTKRTIRASLAHDVLYKLMRRGLLPRAEQSNSDLSLKTIMKGDGATAAHEWVRKLTKLRAVCWYIVLGWFGKKNTDPKNRNKELVAP